MPELRANSSTKSVPSSTTSAPSATGRRYLPTTENSPLIVLSISCLATARNWSKVTSRSMCGLDSESRVRTPATVDMPVSEVSSLTAIVRSCRTSSSPVTPVCRTPSSSTAQEASARDREPPGSGESVVPRMTTSPEIEPVTSSSEVK